MKLVFIGVRQHQTHYFRKLCQTFSSQGKACQVISAKSLWLPEWSKLGGKRSFETITELKVKELAQARKHYRLPFGIKGLVTFYFKMIAGWKYACFYRGLQQAQGSALAMWGGAMFNQSLARMAADDLGYQLIYLENGLLPNTTTVDGQGVNFHNSLPREADFYLHYHAENVGLSPQLVERKPHKSKSVSEQVALPEKFIFVPFQVDVDRQILLHSPWIQNMRHLFQVLINAADWLPDDWHIVIKEHPSSRQAYPDLHQAVLSSSKILFANANQTQALIEASQAVVTINSTVGLEALLLGKPVVTLGEAFYAFEPLVKVAMTQERLNDLLSQPQTLVVSEALRQQFLSYLSERYCVAGSWKEASEAHMQQVLQRIEAIVEAKV